MSGNNKSLLKIWQKISSERGPELLLFQTRYDMMKNPRTGRVMKRVVLEAPDWVNVVAITPDKMILFVRQYRFGTGKITTEIPAGLVDPGEDSKTAAMRELKEETGFTTKNWRYLGYVEPNPAFLNNRCHHWLAEDVIMTAQVELDEGEDIEVVLYSIPEIVSAVQSGEVDHVLALSALSRIPDIWQLIGQTSFPLSE